MAHDPTAWGRAVPKAKANGATCVARMVFVVGMGAAVWIATIWASQIWWG
jgi:hypothetical protein